MKLNEIIRVKIKLQGISQVKFANYLWVSKYGVKNISKSV